MLTYFNRLRGLSEGKTWIKSQTARRLLCAVPFGALAVVPSLQLVGLMPYVVALFVLLTTFGAFTDGHGNQYDLAKSDEANEKPNHWDKIFGKEGFLSEFLGLTASGLLVAIPLSCAFAFTGHYLASVSFLIMPGMLKGAAYWLAQKLNFKFPALWADGNDSIGRNPDGGEVLWGATMDIGLLLTLILLLLGVF